MNIFFCNQNKIKNKILCEHVSEPKWLTLTVRLPRCATVWPFSYECSNIS